MEPWAAAFMGVMSGSVPWYTMMVLHRRSAFFQQVDDTLGVFHTHGEEAYALWGDGERHPPLPRHSHDRQHFPPNNIIHMLGGAGFLWLGWTGFNGGSPMSAGTIAPLAIVNTHLCTATSLLVWLSLDMLVYKKSFVIGAVQGMITGLVCITL
ncbi:unnamed protein product [Camellia sinensis]